MIPDNRVIKTNHRKNYSMANSNMNIIDNVKSNFDRNERRYYNPSNLKK